MTKSKTGTPRTVGREIVSLADLVPSHEVKGGGGRRVFGADAPPRAGSPRTPESPVGSPGNKAKGAKR